MQFVIEALNDKKIVHNMVLLDNVVKWQQFELKEDLVVGIRYSCS